MTMRRKFGRTSGGKPRTAILAILAMPLGLVTGLTFAATPADAAELTVAVTILEVQECCDSSIDDGTGADFYGQVIIDGKGTGFDWEDDEDAIFPNSRAAVTVDHTRDNIPISIEIRDEDDGPDDVVDVSFGSDGHNASFDISLRIHDPDHDCEAGGDGVHGYCNGELESFGGSTTYPERARIRIRVEVTDPTSAPGLHISCTHSPLWPQPGEQVTITARVFSDQPDGQAMPANLADKIEIWLSTDDGATRRVISSTGQQTTMAANQTAGTGGSRLSYGCRAVDANVPAFSGWKTTQVGDPPAGRAVPVLLTERARERAMDIVLFPATVQVRRAPLDPNDLAVFADPVYAGPRDPAFLTLSAAAVAALLKDQVILDNQRSLNIWIALDGAGAGGQRDLRHADGSIAVDTTGDGVPDGDGRNEDCQLVLPDLGQYGWSNANAILHRTPRVAGCETNNTFTADSGSVFAHETGHAAWGLSDEYAGNGGYQPPDPFPNVYDSQQDCTNDVGNLGGVAADCRGLDSLRVPGPGPDFWVSDPVSNDLMVDDSFARRADRRRILYVFDLCNQAKC